MLLSMTGFGEAQCQQDDLAVAVEVRTVNSRFFKLAVRAGEGYGSIEPQIEAIVRKIVRRGTVQVNVRVDRTRAPEDYRINAAVLERYRLQIEALGRQWDASGSVPLESLLSLPGVVDEAAGNKSDAAADWPLIRRTVETAMENLARMRAEEGRAMAADLKANCRTIAAEVDRIAQRAPLVVDAFRGRLEDRLGKILGEVDVALDPADVLKEVGLIAERCDISEEIVRLRSHLDQFEADLDSSESSGRKLEFLSQEMFRETNTIGSKANDVEIARGVIEIKAAVERIREMIQNIE